jgi:hypothetical protein
MTTPMRDDFAALILSHGRPDTITTLGVLSRCGYTGRWYMVVDDQDDTLEEYRARYGEHVVTFSKDEVGLTFDKYDNSPERRSVVWARNACWQIAHQLGLRYFIQLDDDYTAFAYRLLRRRPETGQLSYSWKVRSLDAVFGAMVRFVEETPALTVCLSQGGDHLGGAAGTNAKGARLIRKAMNSFVCDVQRPFTFVGRINEDVNTYVTLGALGHLFLTYTRLSLHQIATQAGSGGMTDLYLSTGTYVKSMFTVIAAPSCTTIQLMGGEDWNAHRAKRLHHHIDWRYAVPKIIHQHHQLPTPA